MTLDPIQVRVLGALIEKEIVTPETYPLSLNALLAACNQRSSRDPVLDLTEEEVRQALHALEDLGMTAVVRDSRVAKYEHRIRTVLNLRRDETAILCLLFLRGPQTPGELRSRADRLFSFDGLEGVESTLARMTAIPVPLSDGDAAETRDLRPLAVVLPRQPGSREARYAHLLGGAVEIAPRETSADRHRAPDTSASHEGPERALAARVSALEAEVEALRAAVAELQAGRNG
ncbi:MAG: YceH family protein [Acidobacteriota bacterium]|nr:YceH family protein [Acidobacteriota bacterium]